MLRKLSSWNIYWTMKSYCHFAIQDNSFHASSGWVIVSGIFSFNEINTRLLLQEKVRTMKQMVQSAEYFGFSSHQLEWLWMCVCVVCLSVRFSLFNIYTILPVCICNFLQFLAIYKRPISLVAIHFLTLHHSSRRSWMVLRSRNVWMRFPSHDPQDKCNFSLMFRFFELLHFCNCLFSLHISLQKIYSISKCHWERIYVRLNCSGRLCDGHQQKTLCYAL